MFITFEGVEGAGKSTIARLVAQNLAAMGHKVVLTREPGDNSLGQKLRPILLDARNANISSRAELHLFLADRAQHLAEVILPALAEGKIVLCDRYADSTVAYQGYGRGQDIDKLHLLNSLATDDLEPAQTLLLDLPVKDGLKRAESRNLEDGTMISEGRFDSETLSFHEKVRLGYLALAKANPERFVIINALPNTEEVSQKCLEAILKAWNNLRNFD